MERKLFLLAVFTVFAGSLFGSTITIAVDGSGDFSSIQAGIEAAVGGDVVLVSPGRYFESIDFGGKDIVVSSVDPWDWGVVADTIIDANGFDHAVVFDGSERRACRLEGLTVTGGFADYVDGTTVHERGGGILGGRVSGLGAEAVVNRCIIRDNRSVRTGSAVWNFAGEISNCLVHDNYTEFSGSIAGCNGRIINCVIYGNVADGLPTTGILAAGAFHNCDGYIANCTITDNISPKGVALLFCDADIINCIISGKMSWAIDQGSMPSYSCFVGANGDGNIEVDPMFVDAAGGDYRLLPGSECIDGGTNVPVGGLDETDIEGAARVLDGDTDGEAVVDIGAYEAIASEEAVLVVSEVVFDFNALEGGDSPVGQVLRIRNGGLAGLGWFVEEDCVWLSVSESSGSTASGGVSDVILSVDSSGMVAGDYSCEVVVSAEGAINSPQVVVVNLSVVGPVIEVSENVFDFVVLEGDDDPNSQSLVIQNAGGGIVEWAIEPNEPCEWITIAPISGSLGADEEQLIRISVDSAWLDWGDYSCGLTVNAPGAENGLQNLEVTLDVVGPVIEVSETSLVIYCDPNFVGSVARVLTVRNAGGGGVMDISISTVSEWINAPATAMIPMGAEAEIAVNVEVAGGLGTYEGQIVFESAGAENSPVVVPVTLRVKPAKYSGGGGGTKGDPYRIGDAWDIVKLGDSSGDWGKHFVMVNDIDLAGVAVKPIGNYYDRFVGSFDGGGHVILNLTMNLSGSDYVGLFGYLWDDGEVRNLGLDGGSVTGNFYVGGLVGYNISGSITNCSSTGSVSGDRFVGGLEGYNISGSITNCSSAGSVSGDRFVGGLEGYNRYGLTTNCSSAGSVSGDRYVGGLVGYNYRGTITNCYSAGSVIGDEEVGGLVGYIDRSTIINCYFPESSGANNGIGDALSDEAMRLRKSFEGWDFLGDDVDRSNDVWKIIDGFSMPMHLWDKWLVYVVRIEGDEEPVEDVMRFSNTSAEEVSWFIDTQNLPDWLEVLSVSGTVAAGSHVDVPVRFATEELGLGIYQHLIDVDDSSSLDVIDVTGVLVYVVRPAMTIFVPGDYTTIQSGIDAAVDGDVVEVGDGIYTGYGNRDIDFKGKGIVVRSANGAESCVIDCEGTHNNPHRGFTFHSGEDSSSVLDGFTIRNGYSQYGGGIYCSSGPVISNCIIRGNRGRDAEGGYGNYCDDTHGGDGAGIYIGSSGSPTIVGCLIIHNITGDGRFCSVDSDDVPGSGGDGGGIHCRGSAEIRNCTIVRNYLGEGSIYYSGLSTPGMGGGVYVRYGAKSVKVVNCIVRDNEDEDIESRSQVDLEVLYSNVEGGWEGEGNIDVDPLFSGGYWDPNGTPDYTGDDIWVRDYHLKSEAGRWDPVESEWVYDDVTSACIDGGNPGSDWGGEYWPHGGRINMGAYGGTKYASMSLDSVGSVGDLDYDFGVGFLDFGLFSGQWGYDQMMDDSVGQGPPYRGDLDRDGVVGIGDLVLFAEAWMEE